MAPFLIGADANYTPTLEHDGHTWSVEGPPRDLFALLKEAGFNSFRLRIWTGQDGPGGLNEACALAQRAQAAGLQVMPVLFLSENWADYVKQPLPAIWKGLSFEDKVKAVQAYAAATAARLAQESVKAPLFEIGNEIDFGLAGEFEEEWGKRLNPAYMQATIWPRMARLIQAAEAGVRQSYPDAKFTLHLTQWWNSDFATAFFQTMLKAGVTVDFAGLSFYPTSGLSQENSLEAFHAHTARLHQAIQRPILICEFAYPAAPQFPGQFSTWNKPVAGFSLDPEGQARYIAAFLKDARATPYLSGVFYWSPEWYVSDMWTAFSLFDSQGHARPAWKSFAP